MIGTQQDAITKDGNYLLNNEETGAIHALCADVRMATGNTASGLRGNCSEGLGDDLILIPPPPPVFFCFKYGKDAEGEQNGIKNKCLVYNLICVLGALTMEKL